MSRKESLGSCSRAVLADERPAAWNWLALELVDIIHAGLLSRRFIF